MNKWKGHARGLELEPPHICTLHDVGHEDGSTFSSKPGGIYLFDDESSVKAFLESDLVQQVTSRPALSDFSVKQFDVVG